MICIVPVTGLGVSVNVCGPVVEDDVNVINVPAFALAKDVASLMSFASTTIAKYVVPQTNGAIVTALEVLKRTPLPVAKPWLGRLMMLAGKLNAGPDPLRN